MGQFILCIILLVVIAVQAIVIKKLKRKYRDFQKEVDIERRVNYSHFD